MERTLEKSKLAGSNGLLLFVVAALSVPIACGGGVKGNTYVDNGNVV
jgi:hypothetical protein